MLRTLGQLLGFEVTPSMIFRTLRTMMFALSVVLVDGAISQLVPKHRRRTVLLLVASSYVTCSFQVHTFSNSFETLGLLWVMVLGQRILTVRALLLTA
jgi:phosphatidylinositol glycan class Z